MPPPSGKRCVRSQARRAGSVWRATTIGRRTVLSSLISVRCAPSESKQVAGRVDDFLQHLGRVGHVDDAARDSSSARCATRARVSSAACSRSCSSDSRSWLQQVVVVDGRGGVVGQGAQEGQLLLVERVRFAGEDAEYAKWLLVGEHRRRGHRAHFGRVHDVVGHRMVGERRSLR